VKVEAYWQFYFIVVLQWCNYFISTRYIFNGCSIYCRVWECALGNWRIWQGIYRVWYPSLVLELLIINRYAHYWFQIIDYRTFIVKLIHHPLTNNWIPTRKLIFYYTWYRIRWWWNWSEKNTVSFFCVINFICELYIADFGHVNNFVLNTFNQVVLFR